MKRIEYVFYASLRRLGDFGQESTLDLMSKGVT